MSLLWINPEDLYGRPKPRIVTDVESCLRAAEQIWLHLDARTVKVIAVRHHWQECFYRTKPSEYGTYHEPVACVPYEVVTIPISLYRDAEGRYYALGYNGDLNILCVRVGEYDD